MTFTWNIRSQAPNAFRMVDWGDGWHILSILFSKVKCLVHFGFGMKYSCDFFSFKVNNLGLSNRMRKVWAT